MIPCCLFITRNPALLDSLQAPCSKPLECGRQARFRRSSRSILPSVFMDIPLGPVVLGSKLERCRVEKAAEAQHFPSASGRIITAARGLLAPSACRAVAGGTRRGSCVLLTPALSTAGRRSHKSTFILWCSQIAPHGCCKGAGGEYHSPTKAVPENSASLWLVVSAVWGKGVSFCGGEWVVGTLPLPSSLVLSAHRHVCLPGERGRRDNLTDAGCVS